MTNESLESQVERLAQFIMHEVPGEPHESAGAIDTAIHIIRDRHFGIASEPEFCPAREDHLHCEHWYDGEPCCNCGSDAGEKDEVGDER